MSKNKDDMYCSVYMSILGEYLVIRAFDLFKIDMITKILFYLDVRYMFDIEVLCNQTIYSLYVKNLNGAPMTNCELENISHLFPYNWKVHYAVDTQKENEK